MKKILFLSFILGIAATTSVHAQPSQPSQQIAQNAPPAIDKAGMLQQMKDKFKMPMVQKTGLTEAQADRVIEINLEMRLAAGTALQGLSDADRSKKLAELKADKEKKFAAIPLSEEQIKSVYAFFEDMGKNAGPRSN